MRFSVNAKIDFYLVEWMRFDLRELVLHVIGIHCSYLIPGWSSQNLDDFNQLIDARLSREQWLPKH
jgi:hypothetical protein